MRVASFVQVRYLALVKPTVSIPDAAVDSKAADAKSAKKAGFTAANGQSGAKAQATSPRATPSLDVTPAQQKRSRSPKAARRAGGDGNHDIGSTRSDSSGCSMASAYSAADTDPSPAPQRACRGLGRAISLASQRSSGSVTR